MSAIGHWVTVGAVAKSASQTGSRGMSIGLLTERISLHQTWSAAPASLNFPQYPNRWRTADWSARRCHSLLRDRPP